MDTAGRVIKKFGGQSALARLLGKRPSAIQYWFKTGRIPTKWHSVLLQLAAEQGLDLSPGDLVAIPEAGVLRPPGDLPEAKWPGLLDLGMGGETLECYVLSDGRRVISRTGATNMLTGGVGGGNLESYLRVKVIARYVPSGWEEQLVDFRMPGVVNKSVRGISAETFLDICRGYVRANNDRALDSDAQRRIAMQATIFVAACAKIGLLALIDEATGYQYERAEDALQLKLRKFLLDEMRQWEKTFPDELWKEFGRLTQWTGAVHQRPKYWGKLVMELIYEYLDKDVADWLRENAPTPRRGQNYHQWLTGQYGLRKLTEHIWMVIGIASTCHSIYELRMRLAERFGKQPVQFTLFMDPPYRVLPGHSTSAVATRG